MFSIDDMVLELSREARYRESFGKHDLQTLNWDMLTEIASLLERLQTFVTTDDILRSVTEGDPPYSHDALESWYVAKLKAREALKEIPKGTAKIYY